MYLGPLDELSGAEDYAYSFETTPGMNGTYFDDFGKTMLVADVTHDGHHDLVLSARLGRQARVYVFAGPFTKRAPGEGMVKRNLTLDDADVVLHSDPASLGSKFGTAFTACDLDDSPGLDLIVGDPRYNTTMTNVGMEGTEGAVFVFSGPLTNASYQADDAKIKLEGYGRGWDFSSALECGELDGMPGAELVISEPGYNSSAGRLLVYTGFQAGLPELALSFYGPLTETVVEGPMGNLTLYLPNGYANAFTIMDFNGDAAPDLVVSCFQYPVMNDNGSPNEVMNGEVYVYWGPFEARGQFLGRDEANVIIRGAERNEQLAAALLPVPSLNEDGIQDLVLTSPFYNRLRGKVLIFHGINVTSDHPQILLSSTDAAATTYGEQVNDGLGKSLAYLGFVSNNTKRGFALGSPLAPSGFSNGAVSVVEQIPTRCPLYTSCESCANAGCVWCKGNAQCLFRTPVSFLECPGQDLTLEKSACPGFRIRDILIALGIATGVCFGFGLLASRLKRVCSEDPFQKEERMREAAKELQDEEARRELAKSLQVTVEDVMFGSGMAGSGGAGFGPAIDYGSINSTGSPPESPALVVSPADVRAMFDSPDRFVISPRPPSLDRQASNFSTTSTSTSFSTGDDLAQAMTTFSKTKTVPAGGKFGAKEDPPMATPGMGSSSKKNRKGLSVVVPERKSLSFTNTTTTTNTSTSTTGTTTPTTSSATTSPAVTPKLNTPRRHKLYTDEGSVSAESLLTPTGEPARVGPPPLLPTGSAAGPPPLLPTGPPKPIN